jgi:hypothetical protein
VHYDCVVIQMGNNAAVSAAGAPPSPPRPVQMTAIIRANQSALDRYLRHHMADFGELSDFFKRLNPNSNIEQFTTTLLNGPLFCTSAD